MTAKSVSPEKSQPATERNDIFHDERVMLSFIKSLIEVGSDQRSRYFETEDMAKRARTKLLTRLGESAGKVSGLYEIPLRFGGSGVMLPAILFGDSNDDNLDMHMTKLAISNHAPLRPLRPPTTVDATYADTVISIGNIAPAGAKPLYRNAITIVANQLERNNFRKTVSINGAEAAQIVIKHNYLIDTANSDITVEVPILSDLSERRESIDHLATHGIRRSRLVHELKTLGQAITTDDDEFINLRQIGILHSIARSSEIYLSQDICSGDDIASALLSTIGRGREVKVSGKGFDLEKPDELYDLSVNQGVVHDTMTLEVGDEPVETPVLVVEDDDKKYFLPFKHIDSFSF